jgi:hypothetical protein
VGSKGSNSMSDESNPPTNPDPVVVSAPLHAALMHAGMTAEQADGVARAIADYVDTLVGGHWINQAPKKPKPKKKAKAKKQKKRKR